MTLLIIYSVYLDPLGTYRDFLAIHHSLAAFSMIIFKDIEIETGIFGAF